MKNFNKILFDKLLATLFLSLFLPFLDIFNIILFLDLYSCSRRIGKDELFNLIDFRSMSDEKMKQVNC